MSKLQKHLEDAKKHLVGFKQGCGDATLKSIAAALAEAKKVEETAETKRLTFEIFKIERDLYRNKCEQLQAKLDETGAMKETYYDCWKAVFDKCYEMGMGLEGCATGIGNVLNFIDEFRWRNVSEGELPNEGNVVLVEMEGGYIGKCAIIDGEWDQDEDIVVRWMPIHLPEQEAGDG